jgi:diacylglycerol kinase family enzyme
VGALDAFVDAGERRVDLAEVNGRVFVNNVSLGVYAEAVQRAGYREAKLRTLLETAPDVLGPGRELDLSWNGPDGGEEHAAAAILVSNNRYRLGRAVGSGTRPRIDDGVLGITVVGAPPARGEPRGPSQRPWREWSAPAFEIRAENPVPAGIDGEALTLEPPLRFVIRSRVLTVRIARAHPGASPSAGIPDGAWQMARALARIAAGRQPRPELGTTTTKED